MRIVNGGRVDKALRTRTGSWHYSSCYEPDLEYPYYIEIPDDWPSYPSGIVPHHFSKIPCTQGGFYKTKVLCLIPDTGHLCVHKVGRCPHKTRREEVS